ncbi:MAG: hypothetical protein AB7I27_09430 [Bacteriovoracaceae bacterium]
MQKLLAFTSLLVLLAILQNNAFAVSMNCKFKEDSIGEVKTIKLSEKTLIINQELEVQLEKSKIRCGNFGRQVRFDGINAGFQVVLESCSTEAALEGLLIDSVKVKSAGIVCNRE